MVPVWQSQFEKHLTDPSAIIVCAPVGGTAARRLETARTMAAKAKEAGKPFVLVLNHETAWRLKDLLKPLWGLVVVDESHRSTSSPRSRFYTWAWRLRAKKRVCLSGTPMSHSPANIWPQVKFLDPDRIHQTFTQFKADHCVLGGFRVNGRPVQVLGWQRLDELERRIAPLMDIVKKTDVLDLPPVIHEDRIIELPPSARRVYDALESEMMAYVSNGIITAGNALSKCLRLQQIVQGVSMTEGGAAVTLHEDKAAALAELLEDMAPTEPLVVFAKFHSDLDAIKAVAIKLGRPFNELSGRINEVGAHWTPASGAVAGIQIQAGGVGISLTEAAYCCFYAQTWSLSDFDQAIARLNRPGQTRPVTFIHLIAKGTIDETIRTATDKRRNLVQAIIERLAQGKPPPENR